MSEQGGSGERTALPPGLTRALGERFQLGALLGRGAMGAVWRARDAQLGRDVALKLLTRTDRDADRRARFEREARIVAALQHPGIVRLHGAEQAAGVPFLVLELVEDARPLDQALAGLGLRERVGLVRDAARALGYAHGRGVVHRDVKPGNLLVGGDGQLKVVDFGVAALAGDERLTRTGAMVGTPFYAAPEQLQGVRDPGPPADVWGLGVVLYEALTGQLPYQGETLSQLILQVSSGPPRSPRQLDPALPAQLEAICLRALARDPGARYPHGEALAEDLDAWLRGAPVSASGAGQGAGLVRLRRAAPFLVPLLLAVALPIGLVAWGPGTPARAPTPLPPALERPRPAHPRAPAPVDPAAQRRLEELRRSGDPAERVELAAAWLRDFPDHPAREEVGALRDEAARRAPLRGFRHGSEARVAWLDARQAISWGLDGRLVLWDLAANPPLELRSWTPCEGAGLVAVAHTGGRLLVGGQQDRLAWLELSQLQPHTVPGILVLGGVTCVAMWRAPSGDSRWLIGTEERGVWDYEMARTGNLGEARALSPPGAPVRLVGFTPDGARALVVSGDGREYQGRVQLWDAQQRRLLGENTFVDTGGSLAISPDGSCYAVGTALGRILIGRTDAPGPQDELRAGEGAPRVFPGAPALAHHNRAVTGVAFSPDGRRLYSAAEGAPGVRPSELKVWDLETKAELRCATLREPVRGLSISPDGKRLLVALAEGELQEWKAD